MKYEEMRSILRKYFSKMLEAHKQDIRDNGHLTPVVVAGFENAVEQARSPTSASIKEHMQRDAVDVFMVQQMLESLGLRTDLTDDVRKKLVNEYRRADAECAKAVLDYNRTHDPYILPEVTAEPSAPTTVADTEGDTLEKLVGAFWKYATLEKRWIAKTEGEKQEHIDLLYEVFGRDRPIEAIRRSDARELRDILSSFPVNRNKDVRTKGKSLDEILSLEGLRTLHPLTINKYLQTYNGFFNWAKLNGYCNDNPFAGLSLRTDKANREPPRLPFSDTALESIRSAVLCPERNVQEHHKWGTLIAMYSGARLNEVAQLHLTDVKQIDQVWCFDINQEGHYKKLKNAASKRIVPIHPRLIERGLLEYVAGMRTRVANDRLFPQLTYSLSDGYGRNLGRWFNEMLLPDLGIKTRQLTFHSLRHSMVARLIAADVTQPHIMALVGHEPGTTTLKTYNRNGFPPRQLLEALEKVA